MSGDTGVILGPIIAGRLADVASYRAAFLVTAAVLGLAALVSATAAESRSTGVGDDGGARSALVSESSTVSSPEARGAGHG
jgi:MFS family permease